jgi:hypothetical protein
MTDLEPTVTKSKSITAKVSSKSKSGTGDKKFGTIPRLSKSSQTLVRSNETSKIGHGLEFERASTANVRHKLSFLNDDDDDDIIENKKPVTKSENAKIEEYIK